MTLALHGKSKTRQTWLIVLAVAMVALAAIAGGTLRSVHADTVGPITFEPSQGYVPGPINGQQGWSNQQYQGLSYDANVVALAGYPAAAAYGFGTQAFQISDALVTNDFGIQTHSPPLANPSSEASNPHFVASFSIGTALATFQPGSHVEVSPDEGNGARMSFLKFTDQADGVHVRFLDVHQPGPCSPAGCATFVATDPIAIFPIGTAHTFTFDITLNPGPGNDVVQIFMDNALIHTGTTWEDYYRYDPESGLTPPPPISKLLFRVSGSPAYNPTLLGTGYLFDNVMLTSGPTPVAAVDACLVPATITGTNGNDVIQGTSGNDVIWALGGNDQVFGNGGDDVICGGTGNDTITTLGGNDSINAGDGNDTVNAGGGSNYVIAGKGDDRITTGDGDDTVDAGDGNDTVNAGGGNNQVTGGKGDDRITTGDGDDTVDGGDGNDTIASGGGTDTLTGGAGNDSLNGGAGTDSCTGGTGNNTLTNCEV